MTARVQGMVGPACVKRGAAYVRWLEINFPKLQLKQLSESTVGLAKQVAAKTCDVLIDASPQVEYVASSDCQLDVVIPGQPLDYGVTDMAIGVRDGLDPHIGRSITYWIQSLKQCARNDPSPHCYGRENIATMLDVYTASNCRGASGAYQAGSLSYRSFVLFYTLLIVVGTVFACTSKSKSPLVRYMKYSMSRRCKRPVAMITCCCRTEKAGTVDELTKQEDPAQYYRRLGDLIAEVIDHMDARSDEERRSQLNSMVAVLGLICVENDHKGDRTSKAARQTFHIASLRTLFKNAMGLENAGCPSTQQQRELTKLKNFVKDDLDLLDYLFPTNLDDRARVRVLRGKFRKLQAMIFDALEGYYMQYHVESWMYLIQLRTELENKCEYVSNQERCGLMTTRNTKTQESEEQIRESASVSQVAQLHLLVLCAARRVNRRFLLSFSRWCSGIEWTRPHNVIPSMGTCDRCMVAIIAQPSAPLSQQQPHPRRQQQR